MNHEQENKIIEGCQAENPRWQKELVLRYSGLLLAVSQRYTRNTETAKDVLQEAFIKIFRYLPRYEPRGSFEGWLRKIVISCALQQLNKKRWKKELSGLDNVPDMAVDPDIFRQMGANELIELIDTLPDGFREVFNLYVIEGYSHKEIGALLGITESTSRSQLTRARKLLQKKLNNVERLRMSI